MEQPSPAINNPAPKEKAPLLVIIISLLMLLGGIMGLFLVVPTLFLGVLISNALLVVAALQLVAIIGLIIVSFGIRRMRRWALYTFTIITALVVGNYIYSFVTEPVSNYKEHVPVILQVLTLIYFWSISKKFK